MPPRPPSIQTSPYRHPSENPKDVYLLDAIIFDSFFKMRFALYANVSLAVAAGLNLIAIHYRANLYAAYTSLSQSNGGLMILLNVLLLYAPLVVCGLQYLLYGPLGFLEIEELYERFIITTIETILAAVILRLEIDGCFMLMFVGILAGKVWIWMGEGRLETHEQQPFFTSKVRCARFSIALLLSVSFDVFMVIYAVRATRLTTGPSMMLLGALDFGVMTISSVSTAIHFAFSVAVTFIIERRSQEVGTLTWDEKYRWMTSLTLTTDFIKMLGYLLYLYIHLSTSGVPIQIIHDTFLTGRSFAKRVRDLLIYQRAIEYINDRYSDSTAEEVAREHFCAICREEMSAWQQTDASREGPFQVEERLSSKRRAIEPTRESFRPKILPCGHTLHLGCLKSWFERQETCPICRRPVHRKAP